MIKPLNLLVVSGNRKKLGWVQPHRPGCLTRRNGLYFIIFKLACQEFLLQVIYKKEPWENDEMLTKKYAVQTYNLYITNCKGV